jgi:hypothetical protein
MDAPSFCAPVSRRDPVVDVEFGHQFEDFEGEEHDRVDQYESVQEGERRRVQKRRAEHDLVICRGKGG